MNGKIFIIDFNRLIVSLLPAALRKPALYAMLRCITHPIESVYNRFINQRASNQYIISITPQVCKLRKLLNDTFDPNLRQIYISDGQVNEWTIIYSSELFNPFYNKQPLWLYHNSYHLLSKQGNISAIGNDFTVMVPSNLRNDNTYNRMVSFLNYYKLASKRYMINYY